MIIDVTFIHQRPQAIAMIWSCAGGVTGILFSLVPQMTNAGTKWRLFYTYWIGPCMIVFFLAFLYYPETYFLRPAVAFDGRVLVQSATEKIQVYEDWEEVPGGKTLPDIPAESRWAKSIQDLNFWGTTRGGWRAMIACYPQMLLCFINPLIFWVMILDAIAFGSMISMGVTYASILAAPPYALDIHIIGLVNLASGIGLFCAWPASGWLITRLSRKLAMNNGGVRDAEHYLPAFILPVLTGVAGSVLYGLACDRKWPVITIYLSYALNSFFFGSLMTASTLWVTEAFPRWAAAAMAVVTGGSYMMSFGIDYAVLPWIRSHGIAGVNIEIGAMILVVGCVGLPIAFWGKRLRQYIDGRWAEGERGALRPQ
jgi:hypothetical protein